MTAPTRDALVHGYLDAKERVLSAGYEADIVWAENLATVRPDATYVMREGAHVILNAGFRFAVARKLWPGLTRAFRTWNPAEISEHCLPAARTVLKHEGKIGAMVALAAILRAEGHEGIVADAADPPRLCRLPFIGKITCWHLAKVLGADVVKPDVHLQRAADEAGHATALGLCEVLREATGDRLTVIDSVLWRYGEQQKGRGWPAWKSLWTEARSG